MAPSLAARPDALAAKTSRGETERRAPAIGEQRLREDRALFERPKTLKNLPANTRTALGSGHDIGLPERGRSTAPRVRDQFGGRPTACAQGRRGCCTGS